MAALLLRALVLSALGAWARTTPRFRKVVPHKVAAPNHVLRVCNAFPSFDNLTVVRKSQLLTGAEPMQYKTCRDLNGSHLLEGDELQMDIGAGVSHTFEIGELPKRDSLLVLVVYRHLRSFMDMSFHSHVFEKWTDGSAQLAVMDTYDGSSSLSLRIAHDVGIDEAHGVGGSEELKYNNVVAVNAGDYRISLQGKESESKESKIKDLVDFVGLANQTYIVLRVGGVNSTAKGSDVNAFPEELMVFPQSRHRDLKDGHRKGFERELQRHVKPAVDAAKKVVDRAKQAMSPASGSMVAHSGTARAQAMPWLSVLGLLMTLASPTRVQHVV
mmetsp:Transcript_79320/g.139996  ORF Transcript_79320/g.139996 Transcript_79320/m.139996 type:complete len:328 (+) Transcript_79320:98-1081(+)|eukprot:CAMPEP_0197665152 /NCGR_PEP_ID=MMETSP1338-20131121/59060_1 /TAXON_ID=43686 ORGANISM="Pelagodinium beii, Strain RCC1491" /NCGR_SAMPLE_ID=MMETSP1338 /ASSEMBLY_ACC=CAM_ASM_000754 /LENGTH=327 /DNA_ID=CAMNT_0043243913 /DNA_START=94 /DNA_END=1077 /DNA_ORIENTATION=-